MKVQICKSCGINSIQDGKCPICIGLIQDSGQTIEIEVNENELICYMCGKPWDHAKKEFKEPPFLSINKNTFYCGCQGFD